MSNLNTIPVEISKLIEFYLENIEVKQLRLVCKELRERVKLRIPRVFISAYDVVLDAAKGTINHEQFRKDIEEIVWDSTLHQYPGKNESVFFEPTPEQGRVEQLILARRLFLAQKELRQTGRDLYILRKALELPNLKRITVTNHIWASIQAGMPVYHIPLFQQLFQEMGLLPGSCKHYNQVLFETSKSGTNLKEFVVDVTRQREYIGGDLFWDRNEPTLNLQTICKNSLHLTRLDLSLNAKLDWSQAVPCLETGLLKDLLSKLPSLERLGLHANMGTDFGTPDNNPAFRPLWNTIEDIFPTPYATHLPNLKHLTLANLFMRTTSVITLLTDLPALQYANLDRPELCKSTGLFATLLHELKIKLVDEENGRWKEPKTRLTIHSDRRGGRHKIVEEYITAFFYERDICPYDTNAYKPRMYWWQRNTYTKDGIKCAKS